MAKLPQELQDITPVDEAEVAQAVAGQDYNPIAFAAI